MAYDIENLKIFCAAAESRSFKEVANKLNISPQAVTRAIKQLEVSFGEVLFVRSTRNMHITQFGQNLYQQATPALTQLSNLMHQTHDESLPVRIAAPSLICSRFIMPLLAQLRTEHGALSFDFKLSDNHSDVVNEQIDIGIRIGAAIKDNRFVARSIGKFSFAIVATPEIVEQWGKPQSISDLSLLPLVALANPNTGKLWPWSFANGQVFSPSSCIVACDDAEAEFQAVLNGVGFGRVPKCIAQPYIEKGRLVPVLMEFQVDGPWEVFIYRPQRGPVAHRVRLVFDNLVTSLGKLF